MSEVPNMNCVVVIFYCCASQYRSTSHAERTHASAGQQGQQGHQGQPGQPGGGGLKLLNHEVGLAQFLKQSGTLPLSAHSNQKKP